MKSWIALSLMVVLNTLAAAAPYDEKADAQAAVNHAIAEAKKSNKSVLLVFGANWCADCLALDKALKTEKNADLIAKEFEIVKINVGRFDRNTELVKAYGEPITKGIPSVVVVSPDNKILYTTKAGELANARTMNAEGVYGFFRDVVARAKEGNQ